MTTEDYNKEPVHYCSACVSTAIKILDDINVDICLDCGSTDIKVAEDGWDEYNKIYVTHYGAAFSEE